MMTPDETKQAHALVDRLLWLEAKCRGAGRIIADDFKEAAAALTAALDRIDALEAELVERSSMLGQEAVRANVACSEARTAWNDAIEAAAECVGHITQSEDRDAILTLKKGQPT